MPSYRRTFVRAVLGAHDGRCLVAVHCVAFGRPRRPAKPRGSRASLTIPTVPSCPRPQTPRAHRRAASSHSMFRQLFGPDVGSVVRSPASEPEISAMSTECRR